MYINSFQFRMEYPIMELLTRDLHYGNRHFNGVKPFFIDNRPCEFDSLWALQGYNIGNPSPNFMVDCCP